jgi:hypothetical protein
MDFEAPRKIEDVPLTMLLAERTEQASQGEYDFRTGVLALSGVDWLAGTATKKSPVFRAVPQHLAGDAAASVSRFLRRNVRSRVRLKDRALSLEQRASGAPSSLS